MHADVTPPKRIPRWAFLPFIVVSIVHVVALFLEQPSVSAPTKLALMPLLAFAVVAGGRGLHRTAALTLLLVAIFFSWLGDGAGIFVPFLPTLPMMLAFFGIAHLAYIVLLSRHVALRRFTWWALIFVAWWAGMLIIIGPYAGDLIYALGAYGIVLGLTAAFATRCSPTIMIGGLFFLASDTILAFLLFYPGADNNVVDAAVMATYALGQGLIAAGVLATLRSRQRTAEDTQG